MMVVVIMMMSSLTFSPNFYILDEPTNHLDMETIEALAKALSKFKVGSCFCLLTVTCLRLHIE